MRFQESWFRGAKASMLHARRDDDGSKKRMAAADVDPELKKIATFVCEGCPCRVGHVNAHVKQKIVKRVAHYRWQGPEDHDVGCERTAAARARRILESPDTEWAECPDCYRLPLAEQFDLLAKPPRRGASRSRGRAVERELSELLNTAQKVEEFRRACGRDGKEAAGRFQARCGGLDVPWGKFYWAYDRLPGLAGELLSGKLPAAVTGQDGDKTVKMRWPVVLALDPWEDQPLALGDGGRLSRKLPLSKEHLKKMSGCARLEVSLWVDDERFLAPFGLRSTAVSVLGHVVLRTQGSTCFLNLKVHYATQIAETFVPDL